MKNNKSAEKYTEVFESLKDEKMNWDFDDFLAAAEKKETGSVLKKRGGTLPTFYWLAAGLVILVAFRIVFKAFGERSVATQDLLVKEAILKQKPELEAESSAILVLTKDSLKNVSDSLVSEPAAAQEAAELVDQILPKRGRLRRSGRPQYVQHAPAKKATVRPEVKSPEYHSNYVMINGQKIENEQEAIDLTKYSFRVLSEKMSKTVAQTDVITNFNNDY